MAARWRIFQQPFKAKVENAEKYDVATIALHNYLRMTNSASYSPTSFIDSETNDGEIVLGARRKVLTGDGGAGALKYLPNVRGSRYQTHAVTQHDTYKSIL